MGGDFVRGARLFGAAQLLQEQFPPFAGFTWAAVEIQMLEANGEIFRGVLGEEPFEREISRDALWLTTRYIECHLRDGSLHLGDC